MPRRFVKNFRGIFFILFYFSGTNCLKNLFIICKLFKTHLSSNWIGHQATNLEIGIRVLLGVQKKIEKTFKIIFFIQKFLVSLIL